MGGLMAADYRTGTFTVDVDWRANKSDVVTITAEDGTGKRQRLGVLEVDGWFKTQFLAALRKGAAALCTEHDEVKVTGQDWSQHRPRSED
jgi:hypothetical protein